MKHEKYKILIEVLDPNIMGALREALSGEYSLIYITSGAGIIPLSHKMRPDLIILGVAASGLRGFEILSKINLDKSLAHTPVLCIGQPIYEEHALTNGAADYISPPLSPSALKARADMIIRTYRQLSLTQKLALVDPLTSLANRRSFDIHLPREWRRAVRDKAPLSFLMLDIDHFKYYNDTYGHLQGDVALQAVASVLSQSARRGADLAVRLGGEEFGLLLPNTNRFAAIEIAEHIRATIEEMEIKTADGESSGLTISIGIACTIPFESRNYEAFINQADKKLYTAKSHGRNRIFC